MMMSGTSVRMLPACGSSFDIHRWRSLLGWVVIIEQSVGDRIHERTPDEER